MAIEVQYIWPNYEGDVRWYADTFIYCFVLILSRKSRSDHYLFLPEFAFGSTVSVLRSSSGAQLAVQLAVCRRLGRNRFWQFATIWGLLAQHKYMFIMRRDAYSHDLSTHHISFFSWNQKVFAWVSCKMSLGWMDTTYETRAMPRKEQETLVTGVIKCHPYCKGSNHGNNANGEFEGFPLWKSCIVAMGFGCVMSCFPRRSSPQIYFGEGNIEILRGVGLSTKSSWLVHLKC